MEENNIPIFKSLTKIVTWGGIPRGTFILLVVLGFFSVIIFKNIKALIPIAAIYFITLFMFHLDNQIFGILKRNLKLRSHYFPD